LTGNLPPWWSCVILWYNSVPRSPSYTLRPDRLAFHLSFPDAYCVRQHMFSKGKGKPKRTGDLAHGCKTCGKTQRPCAQLQQALDSDEVELSSSSLHGPLRPTLQAQIWGTAHIYCSPQDIPGHSRTRGTRQAHTVPFAVRRLSCVVSQYSFHTLIYIIAAFRHTLQSELLCSERKQKAVPSCSEACDEHRSCMFIMT
jgi:hypothetical protein